MRCIGILWCSNPYNPTSHEANGRRTPLQTSTRKPPPLSECSVSKAARRPPRRGKEHGGPTGKLAATPLPLAYLISTAARLA